MTSIKSVNVIVERDIASMFGAALISPPDTMIESIDQELAKIGYIRLGVCPIYG